MPRLRRPFSSLRRLAKRSEEHCPVPQKVPSSGFGYPLDGFSSPKPGEASFSLRRSWASPFRAWFLSGDRKVGFPTSLPLWLFPAKPSRPGPGASAVCSHRKSGTPSCLPGCLRQGGALALLGVSTSRAFPSETPEEKRLSLPRPSRSFSRAALQPPESGTPGVSGISDLASPPEGGASPSGLCHRRPCATS
jgi:hypothetical protein